MKAAPLLAVVTLALASLALAPEKVAVVKDKPLSHVVIFTLKDHSETARQEFIAACEKYLTGHDGTVSFSVGEIATDVVEAVSDREFDVAVHLVFTSKAAGDAYQKSARHQQFVAETKAGFAKVRVFDTYLRPTAP